MKTCLVTVALLGLVCCAGPGRVEQKQIRNQILASMNQQAKDWTAGNLEGFMAGYHKSPDTRFAHPKGITMGWQTVMDGYSKSVHKSRLEFSDIDIDVLAPDAAMVFGRFHNYNRDGTYKTGLYTLLMRKFDGRWVIVHDHSSDLPDDYKPR